MSPRLGTRYFDTPASVGGRALASVWSPMDHALQREDNDRTRAVRDVIRNSSSAAATVILQPLPIVDSIIITPIQYRMVQEIGRLHGHDDTEARRRIFKALRRKLITMNAAIAGLKAIPFVPFVGDLIGMSIAYALTAAIGELSHLYFAGACTMSDGRMVESFERIYREQYDHAFSRGRNELRSMWRGSAIRRQMTELKKAYREGRLTEDEARVKTEELLNRH
jgi:uncharacterized protein (DUF697 family)